MGWEIIAGLGLLGFLLVGALVLFVLVAIYYYNSIVVLSNQIDNAWAQIDIQLKRRVDLIPDLIAAAKRVMKHEKELFTGLAAAREGLAKAGTIADKAKANVKIDNLMAMFQARAEAYPEMKSNENMRMAMEEMSGTESKIAYARQFYNDSVLTFNNTIQMFPGSVFASLFGKGTAKQYFQVEESDRKKPNYKLDE